MISRAGGSLEDDATRLAPQDFTSRLSIASQSIRPQVSGLTGMIVDVRQCRRRGDVACPTVRTQPQAAEDVALLTVNSPLEFTIIPPPSQRTLCQLEDQNAYDPTLKYLISAMIIRDNGRDANTPSQQASWLDEPAWQNITPAA
jgi:hypothetical protein